MAPQAKLAGFDEDGEGFLHPYYDLLPNLDFLMATVDLDGATLVVSFAIDLAAALHLAHRAEGQAGVRRTLRLQARYETRAFHRNHWRPALL